MKINISNIDHGEFLLEWGIFRAKLGGKGVYFAWGSGSNKASAKKFFWPFLSLVCYLPPKLVFIIFPCFKVNILDFVTNMLFSNYFVFMIHTHYLHYVFL